MIGKPRGRKKTYPVYVYDKTKRRKVYIGSAPDLTAAKIMEADALKTGPVDDVQEFTVDGYADRFLTVHHTPAKRRGEPTTLLHNRSTLKPFREKYGTRLLSSISKQEANDWASTNPYSARTVKTMYAEAFREDAIVVDPFAKIRSPKQPGRANIDPLTEAEIEKLGEIAIKAGGTYAAELWALIMFAAWTGMRPGEICALNWAEVDLEHDLIRVEWSRRNDGSRGPIKDKKVRREIVLPAKAREALLSLQRRDGDVFRTPTGKPVRPNSLRGYWIPVRDGFTSQLPDSHWLRRRLIADPKDKLDPYELRHFCGSMLADRGLSAQDISEHLGNTPKVCEDIYIHPHRDRIQKRLRAAFATPGGEQSVEQTVAEAQ